MSLSNKTTFILFATIANKIYNSQNSSEDLTLQVDRDVINNSWMYPSLVRAKNCILSAWLLFCENSYRLLVMIRLLLERVEN